MCGLTLSVHSYPLSPKNEALLQSLCNACAARGPDTQSTYRTTVDLNDGHQLEIVLCASVLGLRGGVVQQPIAGKRGVLGWNGQVRTMPLCSYCDVGNLTDGPRCLTDSMSAEAMILPC